MIEMTEDRRTEICRGIVTLMVDGAMSHGTEQEIADKVGCTLPEVSHCLRYLEQQGIVGVAGYKDQN